MASDELIDIVDENNNVVGTTTAAEAHEKKIMHRIAGVFVFDVDGGLYLQTGNKYGKLDLSVGGHVQKGESYEDAARREMCEEIGLTAPLQHVSTFLPENARLNHFWGIFMTTAPDGWEFKETEEVKSMEKKSMKEITDLMESNPEMFTHGFINAMKEFVRIYKNHKSI
jgi:isopentenyl-diphosphate Delta-isomerase